jgi:hypothetical protein
MMRKSPYPHRQSHCFASGTAYSSGLLRGFGEINWYQDALEFEDRRDEFDSIAFPSYAAWSTLFLSVYSWSSLIGFLPGMMQKDLGFCLAYFSKRIHAFQLLPFLFQKLALVVQMRISEAGRWFVVALKFCPSELYRPQLSLVTSRRVGSIVESLESDRSNARTPHPTTCITLRFPHGGKTAPQKTPEYPVSSMSRFPEHDAKDSVLASTLIPCIFRHGHTFFD